MSVISHSPLSKIAFDIIEAITQQLSGSGNLTDDHLITLHSLFGYVLERALELLENSKAVTIYKTEDDTRSLIEVKGDKDIIYKVFPNSNYCSCPAFHFQVLQSNTDLTCKHVLAATIARLTNKFIEQLITQNQYEVLVASMFENDFE